MTTYQEFLSTKRHAISSCGKSIPREQVFTHTTDKFIDFGWQKDITAWAVNKGRCAIFLDTGLGKTIEQIEWARLLDENTLIIAPLSVTRQTIKEAKDKLGLDIKYVREDVEVTTDNKLWITNYEMISSFDFSKFKAVILDESSILKSIDGKTRKKLTELCKDMPYKLCCTATPAPNDYTEIGNHAEFLGICTIPEMLATFFINANKEYMIGIGDNQIYRKKGSNAGGTEWRIKHHAEEAFFEWLASWAITMTKPSDLGYEDTGFILPELRMHTQFVQTEYTGNQLFFTKLHGIGDRADTRRKTLSNRLEALKATIDGSTEQWIIWVGLDIESKQTKELFPNAVEISGADSAYKKAQSFEEFQDGKYQLLITKCKIGGFGLNLQNAHNMVFLGLNDSWEMFYQAIRREWRYRQQYPVDVYIIMSEMESEIYHNVMRKDALAKRLRSKLIEQVKKYERKELGMSDSIEVKYSENTVKDTNWIAMLGDSCERLKEIADNTVDMSVYSPPFASLFTYSATNRDLGNSRDWPEFFSHYKFIIQEILRVTKPGRLTCVHTSDLPAIAQKDGYIGVKDFPGAVIRAYEKEGWIFTGRAFVQKNPQAQAIRTKSKALLFVQMRKDSADSRPALVDQILIFKKDGDNQVPITPVDHGELDNETWIEWAYGIWLGIHETDTLQYTKARDTDDEKHICPLQLGTIERCIKLYSNPGDLVLSPFMGIGSEGYQALRLGRKFIGIELKESYFNIAIQNLRVAVTKQATLF